ncbi:hypothetical protein RHMOL_Rhmol08G0083200 [Rhododendron molle]|uniref:Uncharacterized protein n=3 Tax=Rhododendron molle TaxID=49168 RepID=A0ACC0MLE8_RHOML|nr:hypothetical protein RHMOL_Rhmol08G0083200 [Rhododendron molle]KAI8541705.1 hypothetical protein RHMOL_Rhmol08G0083200 [Rhododendron molle]KAI8541710.1 hypothetical protein RHMOL_Rhmol08G0083200 [Rhododendron molle]
MERLSLMNETDKASKDRLNRIEAELALLKEKQAQPHRAVGVRKNCHDTHTVDQRRVVYDEFRVKSSGHSQNPEKLANNVKIDRVNLEIQQAEREYDLNHAAELKYGTLTSLQRQLEAAQELEHVRSGKS